MTSYGPPWFLLSPGIIIKLDVFSNAEKGFVLHAGPSTRGIKVLGPENTSPHGLYSKWLHGPKILKSSLLLLNHKCNPLSFPEEVIS